MPVAIPVIIDAVVTLAGLALPPVIDFVRKKWIPAENDTPERTMGSLATTKPEVLPQFVEALSKYSEAQVKWFNRDVIGSPSQIIVDIRAAIRPMVIVVGLIHLTLAAFYPVEFIITDNTRLFYEAVIASWFGSRLVQR